MRVPHRKGVAIHLGPESCVCHRKVAGEALTGELAGRPLSREIRAIPTPTPSRWAEGNIEMTATRGHGESGVVRDPEHARKLLARKPGGPSFGRADGSTVRGGNQKWVSRR